MRAIALEVWAVFLKVLADILKFSLDVVGFGIFLKVCGVFFWFLEVFLLECANAQEALSSRPGWGVKQSCYAGTPHNESVSLLIPIFLKELFARACGRAQSQWR